MGGGTGSGAAPIIAQLSRDSGALTIGVVTLPFSFEGKRRQMQALEAINNLKDCVDTLIIVKNDRLLSLVDQNTPLHRAFCLADDVLRQGVIGISEIILRPGLINVDFADVKAIMGNAGTALLGIGRGVGSHSNANNNFGGKSAATSTISSISASNSPSTVSRAEAAALQAISSPLLDFPIEKAQGVVFNIVGGPDLTLQEINAAAEVIYEAVDENANIIFGALIDESMTGEVAITVIATGFPMGKSEVSTPLTLPSSSTSLPTSSSSIRNPLKNRPSSSSSSISSSIASSFASPSSPISSIDSISTPSLSTNSPPSKFTGGFRQLMNSMPQRLLGRGDNKNSDSNNSNNVSQPSF